MLQRAILTKRMPRFASLSMVKFGCRNQPIHKNHMWVCNKIVEYLSWFVEFRRTNIGPNLKLWELMSNNLMSESCLETTKLSCWRKKFQRYLVIPTVSEVRSLPRTMSWLNCVSKLKIKRRSLINVEILIWTFGAEISKVFEIFNFKTLLLFYKTRSRMRQSSYG